ncbi:signal transduction histidine kinase [Streptosporangium becharense]|uniref:histidine kinase n=1 Tax=Streptosporangium becharense TaxID=1816182 RepID=A0A7W9IDU4_9ACTN|nr:histidine kinase [Streptosporangium becharense]MBB2911889.1 signal transduction histidine kinase [Streptosporangium becharense]MBB5818436.1 signal transduction histidine kinase [Streptosporangium becharense]
MWRVDPSSGQVLTVLVPLVALGLCLLVGFLLYERRRLLLRVRSGEATLAVQQDALARATYTEQRARIARELHDVVAHGVSMMTLGVGAGRMIMEKDPARARETLRVAEESGRQALIELQRTLALLDTGGSSGGRTPQPRLSDLPDLLTRIRTAGLRVEMAEDGVPAEVGLALELSAYRIVQEALENTLRHSGARSAHIMLRWRPGFLEVLVRDDGRAARPAPPGRGLLGMRERAILFGGTLDAGILPEGGFEVRARLPTTGEARSGQADSDETRLILARSPAARPGTAETDAARPGPLLRGGARPGPA